MADQLHILIFPFVVCCRDSIIPLVSVSSLLESDLVVEKTEDQFLTTRLI